MSQNASDEGPKVDRRVQRTRLALGQALWDLVVEKKFETITVQDVLDRAGVGRSTFYAHYRDKDDLFISEAEEFFARMSTLLSRTGETSDRVAPVRELFAHVADVHTFYQAITSSGRMTDLIELAQGVFARGIEQRLTELPRARGLRPDERTIMAQAYSGALWSLLSWWVARGMPASPSGMDDLFHRMVWTGVGVT